MTHFVFLSLSVFADLSKLYFTKISLCIIVVIAGFMRVFSILLHSDFSCAILVLALMVQGFGGIWQIRAYPLDMPGTYYE